jgi:hypothetical protein
MNKILKAKIIEAFVSVLPITAIVLIASVVLTPMPTGTILIFLVGAALLIIGMGFFSLGADMAMIPMGEGIGIEMAKSSRLAPILIITFVMGMIITVAEPDLQVLGKLVPSISSMVLILTVAVGVGMFLVVSVLRTLFKIRLWVLLICFYLITFGLAYFIPDAFIPIAFDSGGVTTGPITVPFMLAMGIGVASIRSDKDSIDDSFGMVALCSIGPILAVMLLGIFYKPGSAEVSSSVVHQVETSRDVVKLFLLEAPEYVEDVSIALGVIAFFFIVFQFLSRRYQRRQLGRIAVGFFYTFIGLVVFLIGVNVGFIPVGQLLGSRLAVSSFSWILIPFGILVGYYIVAAEPAVHVLNKQVEEISAGAITQKMMNHGLSIGMAAALAITMSRILYDIPIMWILVPGYAFALLLTFFVPKIFTGIAFDSGGVCSGPMTSTFLLPLAIGVSEGIGRDLMISAFGIVAMVAMTPLIVIQMMGLFYLLRTRQIAALAEQQASEITDYGEITVFDVFGGERLDG